MLRASLSGLDKKKLRRWLTLFFLALTIPTAILIRQAYSQLQWEAFHQHRVLAEELAARIDARLSRLINDEEARAFTDYAFLVIAGDPSANFVQRSPLSAFPVAATIPGLIGYFQVDTQGDFSTPLLPAAGAAAASYGISAEEREQRLMLANRIQRILSENRLVRGKTGVAADPVPPTAAPRERAPEAEPRSERLTPTRRDRPAAPSSGQAAGEVDAAKRQSLADAGAAPPRAQALHQPASQAGFDRLNALPALREQETKQGAASALGRVEDLKLEDSFRAGPTDEEQRRSGSQNPALVGKRGARKERSALPEQGPEAGASSAGETGESTASGPSRMHIRTFESEIDPLEFSLLDSGHFVLFRKVWRNAERYIQGALIERQPFLQGVIASAFGETALSQMSELIVAYQGSVFPTFGGQAAPFHLPRAEEPSRTLLYQTRLSAPFSSLDMIFAINRLPSGPGAALITWLAAILALVLCAGVYLIYRLGVRQIDLARQQQDFVSAVSHELKTPLTSIRMYGEMLREGWAPEDKKQTYYDYIYDESERLSRLISNVLQLARMTRNDLRVELKPVTVAELLDGIRSKLASQIERAGFALNVTVAEEAGRAVIRVDRDWVTQILINLVDNAVKFSARAQTRMIDIACRLRRDGTVQFSVRDYGPGVPRDQMQNIFRLFYRSENELTRETIGTGIGLALVRQLALAMKGQVDVVNAEPGAEFRLCFATRET